MHQANHMNRIKNEINKIEKHLKSRGHLIGPKLRGLYEDRLESLYLKFLARKG